ncbi:similar to DNA excision repair protein Rad2 [Plenodomus lingam JN3]|uniref:Similar to DNA excision repair protein Rad2 n=1 Tax=Leptosphaeria maculans (strain JN3 / isolate v23.1.3 / race Av1-4-5-6-7-8) TaxID=985895 RepID=E4ZUW0_LEPMJ|nr:similar to DNA excision repair protein Rad2 [Plenodomus lingam JN3]CBX95189.1 similar to DNA excision repair protein Rad2 [Plenodomus lingam JN3]
MGVTGLWTVLQPCARPIKIETLNKKRLAVDASIWIYQFLKAVRDKEGNALRNSHIVGFFRRICKLLFIGIKPVFVFDGGAPALKRQTIQHRKSRREGRREDAVRTAGKLLAIQMQRVAEEEEKKRKEAAKRSRDGEPQHQAQEEEIPDDLVYAEELLQTKEERVEKRATTFKRKDQYHLPDLGRSMSEMGAANDPRVMSLEELEEYARHFDRGEDINVYDFSKIDFDGPFFQSLPPADRYNILNAARLRSRLRMGHSKEQLDAMFPDRMAFSKFQIERVRERNDLTQRLMNLNGMNDNAFGSGTSNRVAGERDREYVLVKNDGVEGGWALGVVQKDEGTEQKPIVVDMPKPPPEEEWEDEDDFEDVPIEGLNRLPKPPPGMSAKEREGREFIANELATRRRRFYNSRKDSPAAHPRQRKSSPVNKDPDSLFLAEDNEEQDWENVPIDGGDDLFEDGGDGIETEQLQQAIALSMQTETREEQDALEIADDDVVREVYQQKRATESNPFAGKHRPKGLAAVAKMANQHSHKAAPKGPFEGSDSEDDMDLQAALAESRKSKRPINPRQPSLKPQSQAHVPAAKPAPKSRNAPGFDGPLPFEKLNLGNSLLGKKKMEQLEADTAGGFERDLGADRDKAAPLPPWFKGERDIAAELTTTRQEEKEVWEEAKEEEKSRFQFQKLPRLRKEETREIIDLDAPASQSQQQVNPVDDEEDDDEPMEDVLVQKELNMGDLADKVRAEPPKPLSPGQRLPPPQEPVPATKTPFAQDSEEDEAVDWSESEPEEERRVQKNQKLANKTTPPIREPSESPSEEFEDVPMQGEPASHPVPSTSLSVEYEDVSMEITNAPLSKPSKSPSPEFEDVPIRPARPRRPRRESSPAKMEGPDDLLVPIVPHDAIPDSLIPPDLPANDSDQYSDPEDEELFASLAQEASEHARFAQELNANTAVSVDFDKELKQLRAQQKKDRRDADEVTQTMITECQHLLTLFGLPYITAPMEAEAQCAELVSLGLVDGIVTDDSDTFLFGGTRVYKNMFNAAKFVECYLASDLASEFSLTRDKLIAIAQLLGSDYTPGIPGIGPVTALEILSEFPDLEQFKQWWTGVQDGSIPKAADATSPFRKRFRKNQATKLFLPPTFPDPRVADAYLHPEVDSDPQPFEWGVPDLAALRAFLQSQIGWSWERTDEVLVPVIRDMNRREKEGTQANITRVRGQAAESAVGGRTRGKGASGKRLGAALERLAEREGARSAVDGRGESEEQEAEKGVDDIETATVDAVPTKRKVGQTQTSLAEDDFDTPDDDQDDEYQVPRKKKTRKSCKK